MGQDIGASARFRARLAGLFYLLMGVSGGLGALARRGIIVKDDAVATAANILAHESGYVAGFAGDLLLIASYLPVIALFYRIFKPVNRSLALTAAVFGLMGCAIQAFALAFQLAPLTVLGGAKYLDVFSTDQLRSLAYLFLRLYSQTYGVALVFFAFYCLLTGYLIYRSTFLPRILGVLMMLCGLSWLSFLAPPFAVAHFSVIVWGSLAEVLLFLWLLVKGVDGEKWEQQAAAARLAEPS